jgi:hypothetical protein
MKVNVFNVEHGECTVIETPNFNTIMVGAGHNDTTGWRPSTWFAIRRSAPTVAVLSNLDRDHFTDLPNFGRGLLPRAIIKNPSVNSELTRFIKTLGGGTSAGVSTALNWHDGYNGPEVPIDYGGVVVWAFAQPVGVFGPDDFNNLSVVTYVEYAGVGVMLPSDLERKGWLAHLRNPYFQLALGRTKVLIASHHGRENGYCQEIFNWCRPELVIISDKQITHETQRHDLYSAHSKGMIDLRTGSIRHVLTTRKDGSMLIDVAPTGSFNVFFGL